MSIPFKFALRRRAASKTISWVHWFTNEQWGSGYTRGLTISLLEGDSIELRGTSNIRLSFYEREGGLGGGYNLIFKVDKFKAKTPYTMPSTVGYVELTNTTSSTIFNPTVDYRVYRREGA